MMASRSHDNTNLKYQLQTDGEITVNLVLTVKLDSDGLAVAAADATQTTSKKEFKQENEVEDDEEASFIIPNFADDDDDDILEFGNKVENSS